MNLTDPSNGNSAAVNSDNMLQTLAIVSTIEHYINHSKGLAFNILFSQSPAANDNCILYMENESEKDMVLEGMHMSVNVACEVYIRINNVGTRNNPTSITPVNLNLGSGKPAVGVFEHGSDLSGGAATLSSGTIAERFVFVGATTSLFTNFEQDLIVPKNRALTVWCSNSAATVTATVPFNYHPIALI